MKDVIFTFIIFVLLMILIILPTRYLNKVCKSLTENTDNIEIMVSNENWDESYALSINLMDSWQEHKEVYSIFAPHIEIDNINMEIYKLSQYVKCKDKTESLASIHLIKFLINHINDLNKASIQNIF